MTNNFKKPLELELESTKANNVSKLKKDMSEKALKLDNLTPIRKRMTKTPTNANKTAGKSINNKIKSILAVTPKKTDQIKMPLN